MPIRVMLADDHKIVRDGLQAILATQADMKVVAVAANGREAVQVALETKPDVLIMDVSMPELNGIDATREIRAASPHTQIIILSMHGSGEHVYRAVAAGARGYLLKESIGTEVVEAIRHVRAGERYLSQDIAATVLDEYVRYMETVPSQDPFACLSPREREIARLVAQGKSNADIAARLSLSRSSVATYRSRLMGKLGVQDLHALVRLAMRHGLLDDR